MAMFMRPDSGSTPVSYPLPTGSAIKAMAESIAFVKGAAFRPIRIEVCSPIRYASYACNYGGPLRKPDQIKNHANFQHYARVLVNPCYKVYGECFGTDETVGGNPCHQLQDMLGRRLDGGQSRFPACLGWKEFAPTYFGKLRPETKRDESVRDTVEGFLIEVWRGRGEWAPRFSTVHIVDGCCDLAEVYSNAS